MFAPCKYVRHGWSGLCLHNASIDRLRSPWQLGEVYKVHLENFAVADSADSPVCGPFTLRLATERGADHSNSIVLDAGSADY